MDKFLHLTKTSLLKNFAQTNNESSNNSGNIGIGNIQEKIHQSEK